MDLNEILSQLGVGSKDTVYLSVTPGVGLELIQIDAAARSVKNYAYRPLEYSESLRQISDIEAFKTAVSELFEELKINIKSNIVLNLPMVLFGSKELPLLLADDAITEALTSEVEQSYIFKRFEPMVSWTDASTMQTGDSRKLFYTAVQKNAIELIKTALGELGAKLVGVQMSLTSLLKALDYSNLVEEQMKEGVSWNLMLVTSNGYSICSMVGRNIVEYYEEPLALKSFEGDEMYNAISASAQITLMSYPANYLFIVSQSEMVSAELLASRIQVEGGVSFWENNDFKKQDAIPVSLEILEDTAHKISLEAIGIASGVNLPVRFDFLNTGGGEGAAEDPSQPVHVVLGSYEFDISPNAARNVAAAGAVVVLIPTLLLALAVPMLGKSKTAQLDEINSKLKQVEQEVKKFEASSVKTSNFNVNEEIKKVLSYNRAKLMAYTAIGDAVPKKLWLTYFAAKDDGKIDIKGESENVEDIYVFFRNMKDSLINTQLRLHKLEMKTDSVDDAVSIGDSTNAGYEFEITNMTDAEISPIQDADPQNPDGDAPDLTNKKLPDKKE